MPPQPIWKIRNLPFLFVCARAAGESVAAAAVRIAPFLKKVRRVIGELDFVSFINWKQQSSTDHRPTQEKDWSFSRLIQKARQRTRRISLLARRRQPQLISRA